MEAAHVRKILLVNLGLLQKDTVVCVHKDSGERIVTKVFSAYLPSNANIPAFLYFLVFLFFFASENFRSSLKSLTSCLNMLVVYNE